jgi:phosphohistidine phosphatase
LLFAAETTWALVVPTPTRAFFFCSYLLSVSQLMKTLLLLRHAKAENDAPGLTDLDRALNERGETEARSIGTFIKQQNLKLDLVLCSTAVRARQTAELALAAAQLAVSVLYDQRIYETSPGRLLEVITEVENGVSTILLVGHNPAMEQLLGALTGRLEPMATGTLARIDFDTDAWSGVVEDKGSLVWIQRPEGLATD